MIQRIVLIKLRNTRKKRGQGSVLVIVWGVIILAMVIISYLLQILFHEIGHMLAGLITGWRLVHLQFFHIILTKDRSLSLRKVPSSACQCIMSPESADSTSEFYTLGGIINNLIITCISLYGVLYAYGYPVIFLLSMCFFSSGIVLLMMNGIPHNQRICNDMACYLLIKRHKGNMHSHNTQFLIAGELSRGKSYSEIEAALFETIAYTEMNDITAYSTVLEYYYHMDRNEFMAAKKALLKITDFSMISGNVLHIYKLELLYLYMILSIYGCDSFQSSLLPHRDEELQYLLDNSSIGDIHTYRVKAMHQAFTLLRNYDIAGAKESLKHSLLTLIDIPSIYYGEKQFCLDQLQAVLNMLNRMISSSNERIE